MRKWRTEFRITQTDLAKHMRVSPSVISDYESGRRTSHGIRTIKKLVDAIPETDRRTGQKVAKRYEEFSDVIPSMKEFSLGMRAADFLRKIDGRPLTHSPALRRVLNRDTVIDSIKAITTPDATDHPKIYRSSSEPGPPFTGGKERTPPQNGVQAIRAKTVPGPDEDVIRMSVGAARPAMTRVPWVKGTDVGAIYVGSESPPYAVKPSATIVAEAIEAAPIMTAADYEFACKAGTAAMQTCMGLTMSNMYRFGMAIGADTSQGAPGDALEYSASAGAAAFLIGTERPIATINHTVSYTTDTPDFWRREGQRYPSHGGRFTGEPAYFKHVLACAELLSKKAGLKPADYDYAVFHQPNGKFPLRVGKQLGFNEKQIDTGLLVREIGNTYSGAIMVGLCAILDIAKAGQRVFAVGYGSGAGSDGVDITVTDIDQIDRKAGRTMRSMVEDVKVLDYATYAEYRKKIRMREG